MLGLLFGPSGRQLRPEFIELLLRLNPSFGLFDDPGSSDTEDGWDVQDITGITHCMVRDWHARGLRYTPAQPLVDR